MCLHLRQCMCVRVRVSECIFMLASSLRHPLLGSAKHKQCCPPNPKPPVQVRKLSEQCAGLGGGRGEARGRGRGGGGGIQAGEEGMDGSDTEPPGAQYKQCNAGQCSSEQCSTISAV